MFFSSILSVFGFLSCFAFQISFSYLCFFPCLKLYFFGQHHCFYLSKKRRLVKHNFGEVGGCNENGLLITCAKCEKVIIFRAHFWAKFVSCSKKLQKRNVSTSVKARNKRVNLAQMITPEFFARSSSFYSVFDKQC